MLLVFPELIAANFGLFCVTLVYPHFLAFALGAIATLLQWMRPAGPDIGSRSSIVE
jgi:hypothetical protein